MKKTLALAIGAGLASALLFAASARGGGPALVVAYVTALPIMIATLGFGQSSGLVAAGAATCAIAGALGLFPAIFFGLLLGFPSWWLGYLSLLARPLAGSATDSAIETPGVVAWYPIGRVVAWAAAIIAAVILAMGGVVLLHYGGYEPAVTALGSRLEAVLGSSASEELAGTTTAGRIVELLPVLMAGSAFLMLILNLWLAGRVVQRSGLLSRPWPSLPENLRMPRAAAAAFVGAGLVSTVGGAASVAGGVIAATFGMAFVLQGLGSAHFLTRGLAARRAILAAIYFITLTIVPSLLALAVLGVVDCLLPLRRKKQPSPPPLTKT